VMVPRTSSPLRCSIAPASLTRSCCGTASSAPVTCAPSGTATARTMMGRSLRTALLRIDDLQLALDLREHHVDVANVLRLREGRLEVAVLVGGGKEVALLQIDVADQEARALEGVALALHGGEFP